MDVSRSLCAFIFRVLQFKNVFYKVTRMLTELLSLIMTVSTKYC